MSWPTSPQPRSVKIEPVGAAIISEAASGRQQARTRGGHRWRLTLVYPNALREDLDPVFAAAAALEGRLNTTTVTPGYYHKDPQGTATSGAGSGTAGAGTVTLTALNGTLKAGDFVKFAGHTKVYVVTADKSAGSGSLSIAPALLAAVSAEALTIEDVPFTCRLASDVFGYDTGLAEINKLTVQLEEAY